MLTTNPVSRPGLAGCSTSIPSASHEARASTANGPLPSTPPYATESLSRAAAAMTLNPPPAVVCDPVARTSPPGSGSAGTSSTTSTTTLPRCSSLVKGLVMRGTSDSKQIIGERGEVQATDAGHLIPGGGGKRPLPVAGAAYRAGHRGDRVAVPAEGRGEAAGQPGVTRDGGGDRERGGHRFLGGQARAHQPVHGVEDLVLGQARDQAGGPRDPGRHVRARDPVPAAGRARGGRHGAADRAGQRVPVDARTYRRGHGGGTGQCHPGVVGQPAGRDHPVLEQQRVPGRGGD